MNEKVILRFKEVPITPPIVPWMAVVSEHPSEIPVVNRFSVISEATFSHSVWRVRFMNSRTGSNLRTMKSQCSRGFSLCGKHAAAEVGTEVLIYFAFLFNEG